MVENCGAGIPTIPDPAVLAVDVPCAPPPPPPEFEVPVEVEKPLPTGAIVFGTSILKGLEGAFASFGICGFGVTGAGFKTGLCTGALGTDGFEGAFGTGACATFGFGADVVCFLGAC